MILLIYFHLFFFICLKLNVAKEKQPGFTITSHILSSTELEKFRKNSRVLSVHRYDKKKYLVNLLVETNSRSLYTLENEKNNFKKINDSFKISPALRETLSLCDSKASNDNSFNEIFITFEHIPVGKVVEHIAAVEIENKVADIMNQGFCRSQLTEVTKRILKLKINNICNCEANIFNIINFTNIVNFKNSAVLVTHIRHVDLVPEFHTLNDVATATIQNGVDGVDISKRYPIWSKGVSGKNQIIQIGDTGLDYQNCYFRDAAHEVQFYPNVSQSHRKIITYVEKVESEISGKDHTDSVNGHGTHVVGSALGKRAQASYKNDIMYEGSAPDAKVVFYDLSGKLDGTTIIPPIDLGTYFEVGYDLGARIFSSSWGGTLPYNYYTFSDKSADDFFYRHQDGLHVVAAGNYGQRGITYPGSSKNSLTVGSHLNFFEVWKQDSIATSSSMGPTYDGRVKPDLVAPGEYVISARSKGEISSLSCETIRKGGTSMATPHVSGSAALLRQYLADGFHEEGTKNKNKGLKNPSGHLIKALLIHSTRSIPSLLNLSRVGNINDGANFITSHRGGYGRLLLSDVVRFSESNQSVLPLKIWDNQSVQNKQTKSYFIKFIKNSNEIMSSGLELRVTMAYYDNPAIYEGTFYHGLVNDVVLAVVTPDGHTYHGNMNYYVRSDFSDKTVDGVQNIEDPKRTDFYDHYNNIEQVRIPLRPQNGKVTVPSYINVIVYGDEVFDSFKEEKTDPYFDISKKNHSHATKDFFDAKGQRFSLVVSVAPTIGEHEEYMFPYSMDISNSNKSGVACANNCSGIGVCDTSTGLCSCPVAHYHIECSVCNSSDVCSGRGTCGFDKQCKCFKNVVAVTDSAGRQCSKCEDGWYGPLCDFQCDCAHNAPCDHENGLCICPQPKKNNSLLNQLESTFTDSCYTGRRCDNCCFDHTGPNCTERSYWCKQKSIREIEHVFPEYVDLDSGAKVTDDNDTVILQVQRTGIIQISEEGVYPDGAQCAWNISMQTKNNQSKNLVLGTTAAQEGGFVVHSARLSVRVRNFFSVEDPYDFLEIFHPNGTRLAHATGLVFSGTVLAEVSACEYAGAVPHNVAVHCENITNMSSKLTLGLFVKFLSDQMKGDRGFTLEYILERRDTFYNSSPLSTHCVHDRQASEKYCFGERDLGCTRVGSDKTCLAECDTMDPLACLRLFRKEHPQTAETVLAPGDVGAPSPSGKGSFENFALVQPLPTVTYIHRLRGNGEVLKRETITDSSVCSPHLKPQGSEAPPETIAITQFKLRCIILFVISLLFSFSVVSLALLRRRKNHKDDFMVNTQHSPDGHSVRQIATYNNAHIEQQRLL